MKRRSFKKTVKVQWNSWPEKEPPHGGYFLVTSIDPYGITKIEMLRYEYFCHSWYYGLKERKNITAWAELPEPYKPVNPLRPPPVMCASVGHCADGGFHIKEPKWKQR